MNLTNVPITLRCYAPFHCLSASQGRWHKSSSRTKRVAGLQQDLSVPCVMALGGPPALPVHAQPTAQDPISSPQSHWSLPQRHRSRAGLQVRTALPHPAMGPPELGPPASPCLSLSSSPWPCLATLGLCLTPVCSPQVNGLLP